MFERYSPTIFLDKFFTEAVMAGWIVTLLGAGLLLLAAAWWSLAQDASQQSPRSGLWRGLCTLGFVTFVAGIAWQLVGYVRFGILSW